MCVAAALAFGGCGGDEQQTAATTAPTGPKLARPVADDLAARSDAIADALDAGDVCTAAVRADELQEAAIRAINERRIPPELQEPLQARANELVNSVNCPPPPEDTTEDDAADDGDEDEPKKKGKRQDKGKGKGKGNGEDEGAETVVTIPPPEEPQP